jgi:hypothetical protein
VVVASALVGVVASPLVGGAALLVGAALVALRGYVVPYTPAFAPRLLAALPVDVGSLGHGRRTDGGRRSESLTATEEVDGDELVRRLAERGVVTADESGELFLADDVRRSWNAGMRRLGDASDGELADATASAAPFPATGRVEGDWVVVTRTDGETEGESIDGTVGDETWLSRAHAMAETAAVAAMGDRVDRLTAARAATPMRLFLDRCPLCGGDVEETVVAECCGGARGFRDSPETPVLACADCEELLYEF